MLVSIMHLTFYSYWNTLNHIWILKLKPLEYIKTNDLQTHLQEAIHTNIHSHTPTRHQTHTLLNMIMHLKWPIILKWSL